MKHHTASIVLALLATSDASKKHGNNVRREMGKNSNNGNSNSNSNSNNKNGNQGATPNIIVFMVDDLGFNQLGFRANKLGNDEIYTPNIDKYATEGIIMDRGYMTPWCGPSRASLQTGTYSSFNEKLPNKQYSFDSDLGFVGGLPANVKTLPQALKEHNPNYKASYSGKWGIGGGSWANTPLGLGYDEFVGFFGDSIEACDGWMSVGVQAGLEGSQYFRTVKDYWKQSYASNDNDICEFITTVANETLSAKEKVIACKTTPRDPPQLIDLDLMEYTKDVIEKHNYDEGPLFHMHASQMLHTSMIYPKKYDRESHLKDRDDYPDYFKYEGVEKPAASNDDMRISYANYMKFLDDLFEGVMDSVKKAGQWDDTIILFTSDNGGAVYTFSASNNYPLRGSKLSKWEGATRVNQFLTGGWIDKNTDNPGRKNTSDTYVFPADWAPTLLEMVGASKELIIGDKEGTTYGNEMWQYIKNSVTFNKPWSPGTTGRPHQLERFVTYSSEFHYNVQHDTTYKFLWTDDNPQVFTRHWDAYFPNEETVIPDFAYQSINPCRPGGVPSDCCYFDLNQDPYEDDPLDTQCAVKLQETRDLYEGSQASACDERPFLCADASDFTPIDQQSDVYSLWSQCGGSCPFTNSSGYPIKAPTKCICDTINIGVKQSDVKYFSAGLFSLPKCFAEEPSGTFKIATVSCENEDPDITNNGMTRTPQGGYDDSLEAQGFDIDTYRQLNEVEWGNTDYVQGVSEINFAALSYQVLFVYTRREGFTEWPHPAKIPHVALGRDSCSAKDATPIPTPKDQITPWAVTTPDVTQTTAPPPNLCAFWSGGRAWCISKQNPFQTPFALTEDGQSVLFANGTILESITAQECIDTCKREPEGTAYIGNDFKGMSV